MVVQHAAHNALAQLYPCSALPLTLQAAYARWNEGQKDRPKQVSAALEAHKARVSAATAAADQQRETTTVKPVPKGKKEQPLELHPDQFVRIKAHKLQDSASKPAAAANMESLVETKVMPVVDVEVRLLRVYAKAAQV